MTEPEDTNTMQAELRALDEALDSGTVTSDDSLERELQELALALRAESPEPSADFDAALRARVQDGFPRERRLPRPHLPSVSRPRLPTLRRPPVPFRVPLPVLGAVASVLVAITVVVSLNGDRDFVPGSGEDPSPSLSGPSAADEAPSARGGATGEAVAPDERSAAKGLQASPAPDIAPVPPTGGGFAPGERERRIERSAALTLAAPDDRIDGVAGGIIRLTDRYDGFVLRSSLSTGDEGTKGGDFELRIPAARLQSAIAELSKLADVRARTQSGQDVTTEFVSAEERLEGARAERRSLLRRLERAQSDGAAESIRRRLDLNAGEIRGLRGRVRNLRTRTNYANVTVTLQAKDGDDGASSPDPGDGLRGAVDDALGSLSHSVEIAIRVLGLLIPLALLAGGFLVGARTLRRRKREATLG